MRAFGPAYGPDDTARGSFSTLDVEIFRKGLWGLGGCGQYLDGELPLLLYCPVLCFLVKAKAARMSTAALRPAGDWPAEASCVVYCSPITLLPVAVSRETATLSNS